MEFAEQKGEGSLFGLIPDLSSDRIFRAMYIPPIPQRIEYGGILYLNSICPVHVSEFELPGSGPLTAFSEKALTIFDFKLENLVFREKEQILPRLH